MHVTDHTDLDKLFKVTRSWFQSVFVTVAAAEFCVRVSCEKTVLINVIE